MRRPLAAPILPAFADHSFLPHLAHHYYKLLLGSLLALTVGFGDIGSRTNAARKTTVLLGLAGHFYDVWRWAWWAST